MYVLFYIECFLSSFRNDRPEYTTSHTGPAFTASQPSPATSDLCLDQTTRIRLWKEDLSIVFAQVAQPCPVQVDGDVMLVGQGILDVLHGCIAGVIQDVSGHEVECLLY